jgi:molybdopterin converting factor small subunit
MKVTLHLFSHLRVIAGTRELALELPLGTTVGGALAGLIECYPDARPVVYYAGGGLGIRLLLNEADATPGQQLADGDELALLPPVGGG